VKAVLPQNQFGYRPIYSTKRLFVLLNTSLRFLWAVKGLLKGAFHVNFFPLIAWSEFRINPTSY
jgi:hypothetical protein